MKDKILKYLNIIGEKLPNLTGNKYTVFVVYSFILVVFILFIMFVAGWLFNSYLSKKADLQIIIEVMKVFCDPGFAALLLLFLKLGVDNNNNGTADILEEDKDDKSRRTNY